MSEIKIDLTLKKSNILYNFVRGLFLLITMRDVYLSLALDNMNTNKFVCDAARYIFSGDQTQYLLSSTVFGEVFGAVKNLFNFYNVLC